MFKIALAYLLILFFFTELRSQVYRDYSPHIFLMQQPDARSEALGRGHATMTDDPFYVLYNPASAAFNKDLALSYCNLKPHWPFTDMENVSYEHYSIGYNMGRYGTISFNTLLYNYEYLDVNAESITGLDQSRHPKTYLSMLSYSYFIKDDLSLGVNLNYFKDDYWADSKLDCFPLDLGVMKRLNIPGKAIDHVFIFGASCSNILNAFVEQNHFKEHLPSILRLGASYNLKLNEFTGSLRVFDVTFLAQYRDLLNSRYYTAGQFGCELSLFEMLEVRTGYYAEKQYAFQIDENYFKSTVDEFTYGFGLNINFNQLFPGAIPLVLRVDYTRLPLPVYNNFNTTDKIEYTVYNIALGINL